MQIQDHDIAISSSAEQVHPVLVGLQKNLKVLPQSGRKQRVKRTVFGIKPDFDHCVTRPLTKPCQTALEVSGEVA
jgi:hypothetical protein